MSGSTTNLDLILSAQASKEVTANDLFDAASPATLYGRRASTTAGLNWGYYGGMALLGGLHTTVTNNVVGLTASATNYVQAHPSTGVVTANTTGFTVGYHRLYTIVTGASTVTSYTDFRASSREGPPRPRQQTVTYSASVTLDCAGWSIFDITLTGNITLTLSAGVDGQDITVRIKQDATGSRTVAWGGSNVAYGTDLTFAGSTATTTANKTDEYTFRFDAASAKYRLVQLARGF